jgi:hypothetical protein
MHALVHDSKTSSLVFNVVEIMLVIACVIQKQCMLTIIKKQLALLATQKQPTLLAIQKWG